MRLKRPKFVGRREPYTQIGASRTPCIRCGAPGRHQWNACSNGNRWLVLCLDCDIAVNEVVLRFLRVPGWRTLMKWYRVAARSI